MRSWHIEAGHLVCRWSEVGQRVEYFPPWMQETSDIQGGYLPPFRILPATVHSAEPLGSSAISLTTTRNEFLDDAYPLSCWLLFIFVVFKIRAAKVRGPIQILTSATKERFHGRYGEDFHIPDSLGATRGKIAILPTTPNW
jgi:hypothetical protein